MSQSMCIRWLAILGALALSLLVFIGAALPLNHERSIDFYGDVQFKNTYSVESDLSQEAVVASTLKTAHIVAFGLLFGLAYLATGLRHAHLCVAFTLLIALLVELEQGFIATRSGKLQDLASALLGMTLVYVLLNCLKDTRQAR